MLPVHSEGLDHPRANSISVNGQGRILVRPDKADINLAVEIRTKTAQAAREQAAKTMTAVIAAVKTLDIDDKDIQTSYVSLSPEYGDNNRITGYQLSNQLMVGVRDVDKAGEVIDAAVQAGGNATRVQGLSFSVTNAIEAQMQARQKAYEDAHDKAKQYAKLAGVNLGRATYINEGSSTSATPVSYAAETMYSLKRNAPSTPVQVGEQEVVVGVDVVFAIE